MRINNYYAILHFIDVETEERKPIRFYYKVPGSEIEVYEMGFPDNPPMIITDAEGTRPINVETIWELIKI